VSRQRWREGHLSLVTDLLVAVVSDADAYDALFAGAVAINA